MADTQLEAAPPAPAEVTILMAVCNGGPHLRAQLDSFAAQSHRHWRLVASDDGSTDDSRSILASFAAVMPGRVTVIDGPRAGFAANFLHLLASLPERPGAAALSDQDDVWMPDRLARGMAALGSLPADRPALWCSATIVTDGALGARRPSLRFTVAPSFRNALVQNMAAGNTILLNPAAARLARQAAVETGPVVSHDWWLYQLVTGAGGQVIYDPAPSLFYRQHGANQIGANDGWRARRHRLAMLRDGRFAGWTETNIAALTAVRHRLTPAAREALSAFGSTKDPRLHVRLAAMARLRPYRQSRLSTALLWLAAAAGRM